MQLQVISDKMFPYCSTIFCVAGLGHCNRLFWFLLSLPTTGKGTTGKPSCRDLHVASSQAVASLSLSWYGRLYVRCLLHMPFLSEHHALHYWSVMYIQAKTQPNAACAVVFILLNTIAYCVFF